jgi:hypothetical protein
MMLDWSGYQHRVPGAYAAASGPAGRPRGNG